MRKKLQHASKGRTAPSAVDIETLACDLSDAIDRLVDADELKDAEDIECKSFDSVTAIHCYAHDCLHQQMRRVNALFSLATLAKPRTVREILILQTIAAYFRNSGASGREIPKNEYDNICENFDLIITAALHDVAGISMTQIEDAGMGALTNPNVPPQYVSASLKALREAANI